MERGIQQVLACESYPILIYLPIYIQAEKERLLYDMQQRRGLDEDGERNAIRRGLMLCLNLFEMHVAHLCLDFGCSNGPR